MNLCEYAHDALCNAMLFHSFQRLLSLPSKCVFVSTDGVVASGTFIHCLLAQDAKILDTDQASRCSAFSYVKCQLLLVKCTSSVNGILSIALTLESSYTACQTTGQVTFIVYPDVWQCVKVLW